MLFRYMYYNYLLGIMEDARDPHLAAKLNQLGAVRVDHHMRDYNISVRLLAPSESIVPYV